MKIKKIRKGDVLPTWDIEVEEVHEYLTGNGCVSHNTSSILGNEASIEAQTSNLYVRRVLSGEYIIVNKYLVRELVKLGIWSDSVKNKIIADNGSVQNVPEIPTHLKEVYKTVWEIKQRDIIDMAAERGAFIDQTQSMNIFMEGANFAKMTAMHFYGWGRRNFILDKDGQTIVPEGENIEVVYDKEGKPRFYRDKRFNLKTGMYYLRGQASTDAVKFTLAKETTVEKTSEEQMAEISCSLDNPDDCVACSS